MNSSTKKKKKGLSRLRRLFSRRKKEKWSDEGADGENNPAGGTAQKPKLPWTPEDIIGEMDGFSIPQKMRGEVLLIEVGGDDRGWVLDFRGENTEDCVVISRYNINTTAAQSKKVPRGPSLIPEEEASNPILNKSLPWLWYKDRKTFSKIETGKLNDTVAFVTGRIGISGEMSKWDPIEPIWQQAKEKATERKKMLQTSMGNNEEIIEDEEEEEEEEEEIDEEARIIATFKPEVEPIDPRKREFWMRHFGTDALVSSYLFLVSSVAYNMVCIRNLQREELYSAQTPPYQLAHSFANSFASIFFTLGSVYFIKLSYPETTMLLAYHAVTRDPNTMSFMERYFTANEMLIALWLFSAAFIVPLTIVALYELFFLHEIGRGILDLVSILIATPLVGVLNIAAMPDCMRMNNGQGSSFFFDHFWVNLLRLNDGEGESGAGTGKNADSERSPSSENSNSSRRAFWLKHLGNDGIAGAWIFAVLGVVGGIGVTALVIFESSVKNWLIFWTTMPFSIGSLLLVRASYPDTMNSSIFFSSEDPPLPEIEIAGTDDNDNEGDIAGKVKVNGERTPLLSS